MSTAGRHLKRPHVPCDFQVEFFGFDKGQTATITFTIHPPSGDGDVLLSETQTVSDDSAAGGLNDVDEVSSIGYELRPRKLRGSAAAGLPRQADGRVGGPSGRKEAQGVLAGVRADQPATNAAPHAVHHAADQAAHGRPRRWTPAAGSLPLTGPGVGGLIAAGLALVGGGTALLVLRRRRNAIEGAPELY